MKTLPYRAETGTGDTYEIAFPLHSETSSAVRVAQLLSAVLKTIDTDLAVSGETSNGDVPASRRHGHGHPGWHDPCSADDNRETLRPIVAHRHGRGRCFDAPQAASWQRVITDGCGLF